jgi:hypothetical protein
VEEARVFVEEEDCDFITTDLVSANAVIANGLPAPHSEDIYRRGWGKIIYVYSPLSDCGHELSQYSCPRQ